MRSRHTLTLLTVALTGATACNMSHVIGPGGEEGVCCPVTDFRGCSPGADPLPAGGWARSNAECTNTIQGWDGRPYVGITDAYGCAAVVEGDGCCGCVPFDAGIDAGPLEVDAGPVPPDCEGLGAVQCLAAGCVPTFDDVCCPSCTDGGCADCQNLEYYACLSYEEACMADICSVPISMACSPFGIPDCSAARPTDVDSCNIAGCVPATPPVGATPLPDTCVPITAQSCTISCRRSAPDCPAGTVPEGDGSCYTDRCIPTWICAG